MKILEQLKADDTIKYIPIHVISNKDSTTFPQQFKSINIIKKPLNLDQTESLFEHFNKYTINRNARILLVEDEVITVINNKKFVIVSVKTGKEAIEKLQAFTFDGIILDLKLPDLEGRELLKIAKAKLGTLPPVVIYSMKDLSAEEYTELNQYTNKIVRKEGDISLERLMNECSLFLHAVNKITPQATPEIKMLSDSDTLLQNKEILLVDDDMRNVYALSMVLKRQGMKVTVATNGEEALKKMEIMKKIDIVIMDIMMPIMDGYETMRHIRKMDKFKTLPIIAITAKAMPDDKKSCIDAGANDYITKPVDDDKLLMMLRIWLSTTERTL
jgi:CheY-like chemotaxis protein